MLLNYDYLLDLLPGRTSVRREDSDDASTWHIPLPGVDPADITVTVTDQQIDVTIGSEQRLYLDFARRAQRYALDQVTADHKHGVLSLRVPLAAAAKPRSIPISTG